MPNSDLGILITLNICLTLIGFLVGYVAVWAILRQGNQTALITERVAGTAERLVARLRRQYADIDQ